MKDRVVNNIEPVSGQGRWLGCPSCQRELVLVELKDGDQGYWCMSCESGWRSGSLPAAALQERRRPAVEPAALAASAPLSPPQGPRRARGRMA